MTRIQIAHLEKIIYRDANVKFIKHDSKVLSEIADLLKSTFKNPKDKLKDTETKTRVHRSLDDDNECNDMFTFCTQHSQASTSGNELI